MGAVIEHNGRYVFGVVKVNDKGQIVIPKEARTVYHIEPGDSLLLLGSGKGMALVRPEANQALMDMLLGMAEGSEQG